MTPTRSEKLEARMAAESAKRRNQLFLFVGALCAIVAIYMVLGPSGSEGGSAGPAGSETAGGLGSAMIEGVPIAELLEQRPEERKTPEEEIRETLAEYRASIEENPDSEEAPALLSASGNIYKQKFGDFARAAQQYEILIADYPDWEGIARIYPELATCYVEMGETEKLRVLLDEMMERFEPETPEYQWAAATLGMRVEPPERVDPLALDAEDLVDESEAVEEIPTPAAP